MKIVLSNDDGLLAAGLAALHGAVRDLGEIVVIAPEAHQSAAGHAITVRHPLTVQRVVVGGVEGFEAFSVDGLPADCVRLAVRKLLAAELPDLVLTGINAGANVGAHVLYSGTVSAAAEAAICGVPAVAFSAQLTGGRVDFARAARLCRWVLDRLLAGGLERGELINVNIPVLDGGSPKGVRVVPQSTAAIDEVYERLADDGDRQIYELREFSFAAGPGDNDVDCLVAGYITVTPLKSDLTRHERLGQLRRRRWDGLGGAG